ncbi:MFS transporter [Roseibium sp. RKSG952]|uniref:MFS transporter n=1 Tax=Roseibium sp. RKSG952 TaxID=2529384 RepID=UPI0012BC32CA|nr:MFS transporter [Roseibium sp. RKSG952]MTH97272.1 MFS transporter [Roseibium sp. RKSG952]
MKLSEQTRRVLIICSMGTMSGLVLLDETVLGVALPTIRSDLDLQRSTAHWIVNAYFLTLACFAAVGGKCVDIFGLKKVLLVSAPVFATASLLAGFAGDGGVLIALRALQGLSAAFLLSLSQAGSNMAFPPEQRGLSIGIYAAIATSFMALGPLVGGVITHYLSWHWIFWVNIPVIVISGGFALLVWREPQTVEKPASFDWRAVALMVIGLTGLVFALMEGSRLGWTNTIILGCGIAGVACLFLFDRIELRRAQPLINVHLFRLGAFTSAVFVFFLGQYAVVCMAVFFPIFLQNQLGYSPAQAGLSVLPAVIPSPVLSVPVGRFADRIGSRRIVIAGTLLAGLSAVSLGLSLPVGSYPLFAVILTVWGIAIVCIIGPSRRLASNAAPEGEQGQLSGTIVTVRLLGATAGVAASSALLTSGLGFGAVFALMGGFLLAGFASALFALKDWHAPQGRGNS